MLHIYLPKDHPQSVIPAFCANKGEPEKVALSGKAVLADNTTVRSFYAVDRKVTGIRATMNRLQKTNRCLTLIIKWNFCLKGRDFVWGGEMKFTIPTVLNFKGPPPVIRYKTARASTLLSEEAYEEDIALLETAVSLLTNKETLRAGGVNEDHITILSLVEGYEKQVRPTLLAAVDAHRDDVAQKAAENTRIQETISALEDGTPLIIRNGYNRTWQLGLKKGRVNLSTARNAMIAPSEILRGEELRKAGLSMHDILRLDVAAQAATKTHPAATKFQSGPGKILFNEELHPAQPFHKSYLTGSREQTLVAWAETKVPSSSGISFDIDGDTPNYRKSQFGGITGKLPKVDPENRTITLKERRRWGKSDPKLHPFCNYAYTRCVNQEVADVLARHNIGDIKLIPATLMDHNQKPFPGTWYYLATDKAVNAVLPELCDPNTLAYSNSRTVQPFEIILDAGKIGDLDLWWDDGMRDGNLFYSDRLVKALKRIKACPPAALKPCRGA